ncbi:MAG: nuclear transport factor 2 family protein [Chthoniobacterales bacterium]|nr:nuclear transport factor 2 family protein [Chthoniobacterales bacterium]
MSTKHLLSFILCVVLSLSAFAQRSSPALSPNDKQRSAPNSPVQSAPDAAELTGLLNEFMAGASRNDAAMHDRFWAEDLIYTSSSGHRKSKADIMREVREESAPKNNENAKADDESTTYTAEEVRIQQYGTTAIVTFRLVGTTKMGETTEVSNYLNSGTFLKRDGKWQVVNWQATKMPADTSGGR